MKHIFDKHYKQIKAWVKMNCSMDLVFAYLWWINAVAKNFFFLQFMGYFKVV